MPQALQLLGFSIAAAPGDAVGIANRRQKSIEVTARDVDSNFFAVLTASILSVNVSVSGPGGDDAGDALERPAGARLIAFHRTIPPVVGCSCIASGEWSLLLLLDAVRPLSRCVGYKLAAASAGIRSEMFIRFCGSVLFMNARRTTLGAYKPQRRR